MTRSHCTEINSLQIEMDQLKEETQRKLAEAETECRRWKDEAKENKNPNRKSPTTTTRKNHQHQTNHPHGLQW